VPIPVAPRDPGADPYAWMRDDAKVLPYLEAERAAYDARIASLAPLTSEVLAELVARTPDAERSVSRDHGSHAYYTLTPPGRELPELRRSGPLGDELLVDLASFGSPYAATGVVEPEGEVLAYSVDLTGAERYTLRFRDMGTGKDVGPQIDDTYYTGAWADGDFYFTTIDELNRPCEVHRVNPRTGERHHVLTEPDQRFELTVRKSQDRVVIAAHSRTTSECWEVVDGQAVSLRPRVDGVEYDVERDTDRWLFLSNAEATEFALAAESTPPLHIRDGRIHDMAAFDDAIVTYSRIEGEPRIRILERDGRIRHEMGPGGPAKPPLSGFPEVGGALRLGHNDDPHAPFVTVVTESFTDPTQWWDVDLVTGERRLRHAQEVPGHDPAAYISEVIHAKASDGWRIPIVVTRRRDTPLDVGAPCMLYGYGSYESVDDPWFESWVLPLLDRGVVYAKAHIRGGGEVGRQQWIDGHLLAKRNSFTDFIAAADHLVDSGIAGPIVGRGGSAGGLLQGAVYFMAPQRWAGIIAEVPFVDCVNSMLDPDIPLTINEWEEWGDPRIPEQRAYMESYTPYTNLPDPAERPPLLVTGAVHDPRVLVHEPAKWVAALRHSDPQQGDRASVVDRGSVAFRVETGEGSHGGQAGRYAALGYDAEVVAWALTALTALGVR
jgi:oligopeptidase B